MERLKQSDQELTVITVPPGRFVTMDYRVDRVRIYTDESGKVIKVPRRG